MDITHWFRDTELSVKLHSFSTSLCKVTKVALRVNDPCSPAQFNHHVESVTINALTQPSRITIQGWICFSLNANELCITNLNRLLKMEV